MKRQPLFIHISPDWCGQGVLTRLFRHNGHAVALEENGRLAEDILYAQATRTTPLTQWPRVRLVTGLYRQKPHWRPPLEAWRSFDWLAEQLPDARFILTTRDLDGWLLDRMARDSGAAARCYAHHKGGDQSDLPQMWESGWHAHLAAVEAYFGDDPRLIRVDMERQTISDLAAQLHPMLPMTVLPLDQDWQPPHDKAPETALLAQIEGTASSVPGDDDYVEDVARFCLRGVSPQRGENAALSAFSCVWDGHDQIRSQKGEPRRMTVTARPGLGKAALSFPGRDFKLLRCEAVINDVLRNDRPMPLTVDMEDSRWLGSPQGGVMNQPVICHNRRVGAQNVVLWPLPDLHSIGLTGFDPDAKPDQISFEDKQDRVVWRGMISGSEMRDSVKPGPASHVFLRKLAEAGNDPSARDAAWRALKQTSRLNFILRHFDHADFDLGIVMAWHFRQFADDPLLAPYCKTRQPLSFFHGFRYQLYLSGYDHGSNFIPMIDSQSVLLKEEDGWEVFYSGRFKPWKHYIPLVRYGADVAEKLAWARANPQKCKEMSAAARAEVAHLRDPATRRAILARILDGLAAAG